ncbi:MAG: DEAD/DEAH box helicase [Polyangiaceae bacterium]
MGPLLTLDQSLPGRDAVTRELPARLPTPLRRALAQRGITSLYSHQAEAIDASLDGRHVVVATPTASGKSLCFHLPVVTELLRDLFRHGSLPLSDQGTVARSGALAPRSSCRCWLFRRGDGL